MEGAAEFGIDFLDRLFFSLPVGDPTVAFSQPQLYHLLRVLTDETIGMYFKTLKRLVDNAIKGTPAATNSPRDQFRS